jgi:penicillin-binding protein 1A
MLYGTGRGAHVWGKTDAGKTGTTDNYADAWFNGFTPHLQAAVWIGYPKGEIPMLNVHGIAVSGPTFPAQIWHAFMQTAIGNRPDVAFPDPTTQPVWTSWRGQYQYSGSYSTSGYSSSTQSATTSGTQTSSQPTPPAQPKPTTVPPATTAAPPPPTTSAPPPAPPPETYPTPAQPAP